MYLVLLRKLAPYLLGFAIVVTGVLWVHNLQSRLVRAEASANELRISLQNEQAARVRDVAGLTTLAQGLVAASSAKASDQRALQETIDVAHPQPASPGLAALLGRLREADASGGLKLAAAGTGSPAPAGTRSAR